MKLFGKNIVVLVFFMFLTGGGSSTAKADTPDKITAIGDSITVAFAAVCQRNRFFWDLFCLLGGDRPEYSWFDGSNGSVDSVIKKYRGIDSGIEGNKSAARSGAEMLDGSNNFLTQAQRVLQQNGIPDHVEVVLGGNDICNRNCIDPRNCNDPVYTDNEWTNAVQAGLDVLVGGLAIGSTVYLGSVPRVQDLRAAGLEKESQSSRVRCESVWRTFGICSIATRGGVYNGESEATRFAGIAERQQRYNEILKEQAQAYSLNANGRNPRGIEVIAEYVNESTLGVGTFQFDGGLINGGDCFHPNVAGHNLFAELMWNQNTDR